MAKILIVEDNPLNLELMETILSHNDYEYVTAKDGESGIAVASADDISLVLMDLQLPGIDGFETLVQIRQLENCASVPVVAVSGNTTEADNKLAMEAGFDDFLAKPYSIDQLLSCIDRLIAD